MLISFTKFIHLLAALGLLGLTVFCGLLVRSKKISSAHKDTFISLNKILLLLSIVCLVTGTFLVHPKHFTFHTPWIQAAYLFLLIFGFGISLLVILKDKLHSPLIWWGAYFLGLIILLCITHDAVMKTTFIF